MTGRPMNIIKSLAVLTIATISVGACTSIKSVFEKQQTGKGLDELVVSKRPPLSTPPDHVLRPPSATTRRDARNPSRSTAQSAVINSGQGPSTRGLVVRTNNPQQQSISDGELALLKQAGATEVDPNVRREVDEETRLLIKESDAFTNRVLFWQDLGYFGEVVDSRREAERLRANQEAGRAITAGRVPVIRRR